MSNRSYNRIEDMMLIKGPTEIFYKGRKMTEGNNKYTNMMMKIKDATRNLISKLYKRDDDEDEVLSSKLGSFIVSIECSKIALVTKKSEKNFIFPVVFNTTLNGKSIEPLSNKTAAEDKKTLSLQVNDLSIAIDGYKLKLNVKNRAET
ncbi:hypothetical protein HCN44_008848 [Aphidius gifuensis]|uniref:Uncharacterized protein n=1 Tax=Aphidius gifuensis TaxID=684658 RepID=A0A834Y414_APHGI|nr:hypothetical protein HCN44_008848 [Aphidius gifuensis]